MRLFPKSLLGQVLLATASALLITQAISSILLYRAAEQRRELAMMNAVAIQLLRGEDGAALLQDGRPAQQDGAARRSQRWPRALRYMESTEAPYTPQDARLPGHEETLKGILEAQGLTNVEVVCAKRPLLADPVIAAQRDRFPLLREATRDTRRQLLVTAVRKPGQSTWQTVRLPLPRQDLAITGTLAVQTGILFLVLFGILYLVLRRITRPLHALADSTTRFASSGEAEDPIVASGPQDVRRLILAHNAMQTRIGKMLDEKDVMLGAIGHDLKTPLAALRVRIESVEDASARQKMAGMIEEITQTLDEILSLARVGRSDVAPEMTELGALAASVVEEFEDMQEPVTLEDAQRVVAPIHLTWLKRGLRNLVTNALRYGGSAHVSILRDNQTAVLRVEDNGPGIAEDRIAEMLEPFTRGESSRNRATGGAGLGLTLARAVAEQHGGTLVLTNRAEGGLRAEIRIPL